MKKFAEKKNGKKQNRRVYLAVISSVALACGGTAMAQTNNVPAAGVMSGSSTNVTDLGNVTVVGQLDQARNQILPDLGASAYTINQNQIAALSQGGNAPMSQIILRAPGVCRIMRPVAICMFAVSMRTCSTASTACCLPEGISGFGLELSPHFIESMQLITGSLPAQYGFRTAGVVDITTKSGAFENGGEVEMYGGSLQHHQPEF